MALEATMREALRLFKVALSFLTFFPVRSAEYRDGDLGRSAFCFPLVGALLGGMVWACYTVFAYLFPGTLLPPFAAVAVWVVFTGGLHLDGWADVCDALFSSSDPKVRQRALKDSRIGVFGAAGVFFLLGIKVAAIYGADISSLFILSAVVGRVSAIELGSLFSPRMGGLGEGFVGKVSKATFFCWILACGVFACWLGGAAGALKIASTFIIIYLFGFILQRSLGGIGGDGVGASIEFSELAVLILWRL